jgi:hypothetical protein
MSDLAKKLLDAVVATRETGHLPDDVQRLREEFILSLTTPAMFTAYREASRACWDAEKRLSDLGVPLEAVNKWYREVRDEWRADNGYPHREQP